MLIKKIDYFYKIYLRQLKRQYPEILSLRELIDIDVNESLTFYENKFSMSKSSLQNKIYWDQDLQVLMILDFFRFFKGMNPFVKNFNNNQDTTNINLDNLIKEGDIEEEKKLDENDTVTKENDYYYTFIELPIHHKIEVLYFFCKYVCFKF